MAWVEICGQPLTSVFSIADHCFISSEIGGIFGRSCRLRALCLAGRFGDHGVQAVALQERGDVVAVGAIVVDDQDAGHRGATLVDA